MKRADTGNTSHVLETIWRSEGVSRVELARRLELDKSTVSHIVGDLVAQGVVEEYETGDASQLGGRRPVRLRLRASYGFALGVEVQPDFCRVSQVDTTGLPLRTLLRHEATSGIAIVHRVGQILDEVRSAEPASWERCLGLGLAVSGIVDPSAATVLESVSLGLEKVGLGALLVPRLPFPFTVENDANAACWGEVARQSRVRRPLRNFLFCLFEFHEAGAAPAGASIGLGFVVGGRIHHGESFSAGEFRSLGWRPGNTFQFSLDDAEMARLKTDGAVQARFCRELAGHLLFLARVFNFNDITFGGDVAPLQDELVRVLDEERHRSWPGGNPPCRIHFSPHGADAAAYGAACLGLTSFFRDAGKSGTVKP